MNRRRGRLILPALCLAAACLFAYLGIWQLERRVWKLDLIERVETRADAPAVPLPPRAQWNRLDGPGLEYRRVHASGRFLHDRETLVEALTERGPGFWVVTPLQLKDGIVLVNRGFVPPERRMPAQRPQGQIADEVAVTGLIRLSEPRGRILRPNQPSADRWFSRDVIAIGHARELTAVAPFFLDAGPMPNPGGYPIGGLTVVKFRNTHLIYALTWFALALLSLGALLAMLRGGPRGSATEPESSGDRAP